MGACLELQRGQVKKVKNKYKIVEKKEGRMDMKKISKKINNEQKHNHRSSCTECIKEYW